MSHGGGGGDDIKAEPNLVPLLDLVMQLLMFFIVNINFVTQQINGEVNLPVSQSARPLDKSDSDVLFLNLNHNGYLEVVGNPMPLKTQPEIKQYLKQSYDDAKRVAKERPGGDGKVKTTVIIRADQAAPYKTIFQVLKDCKIAGGTEGFTKLQLRAKTGG